MTCFLHNLTLLKTLLKSVNWYAQPGTIRSVPGVFFMTETRITSERYEKLAEEIIEKHPLLMDFKAYINAGFIKVIYLESDKPKKTSWSIVHADCEKVPDSKRWAIDADFVITVYTPNVVQMTEEQKKILMLHELMHIGVERNDKGNLRKYLVPHSVQDFYFILEKYGLKWDGDGQQEFNFEFD